MWSYTVTLSLLITGIILSWVLSFLFDSPILPSSVTLHPPSKWAINNRLTGKVEHLGVDNLIGPESLAVSSNGQFLYTGLMDGRIVRLQHQLEGHKLIWTNITRTGRNHPNCGQGGPGDLTNTESICGRPLGMRVVKKSTLPYLQIEADAKEDLLLVCDAYKGLLVVSHLEQKPIINILATRAEHDQKDYYFHLLNDLVVGPDGTIYFTETSTRQQRRRIGYAILEKPTGRLLAYTPNNEVKVLVDNLYIPNGITLAPDNRYLLIVMNAVQIWRYDLQTGKMEIKPWIKVLPGTGDNIRTIENPDIFGVTGQTFFAGLGSKYMQPFSLLYYLVNTPILAQIAITLLPYTYLIEFIPKHSMLALIKDGHIVQTWQDPTGDTPWISEAEVFDGYLYLGSWYNRYISRISLSEFNKL